MSEAKKTCKRCGELKPFSDFPRHGRNKDGHETRCRPCLAAARQEAPRASRAKKDIVVIRPPQPRTAKPPAPYLPADTERTCAACGVTKLVGDFKRNNAVADGYDRRCKQCYNEKRYTPVQQSEARRVPQKMTEDRVERYLQLRGEGLTRTEAAQAVGVSAATVRILRNADPAFAQREFDAECDAGDPIEAVVYRSAMDGSLPAAIFWLTNRSERPRDGSEPRWADMRRTRRDVVHSGTVAFDAVGGIDRIMELQARLMRRRDDALGLPQPVIEAHVVRDDEGEAS